MNPCPCGFLGDTKKECICTLPQIQRYRSRISGPLLDRIDIEIEVPAVNYKELSTSTPAESSTSVRTRVDRARQLQLTRFANSPIFCNAQMTTRQLHQQLTTSTWR